MWDGIEGNRFKENKSDGEEQIADSLTVYARETIK